jgi:nucleotide-binding universal stress UspA family protein
MVRKILTALDGSPTSESILPYLEAILATGDADVTLARVIAEGTKAEEQAARNYLAEAAHTLRRKGAVVDTSVMCGDPAPALVDLATRGGYDLLLLCTRGRKGLKRALFGSVAEEVLRRSPVPVLIVHPRGKDAAPVAIRRILVPLDGSHRSARILPAAGPLAGAFDAKMLFITVVSATKPERLPVELAAHNLFREQEKLARQGVQTELTVLFGDPATEILSAAESRRADLIAICTHGRRGLDRARYGSVAEKILRKSGTPLLVVRTAAIPSAAGKGRGFFSSKRYEPRQTEVNAFRRAKARPGSRRGTMNRSVM